MTDTENVFQTELVRLSYGSDETIIVYRLDYKGEWPDTLHWPRIIFEVESNGYQLLDISATSFNRIHDILKTFDD